ncbi:type 1 periplasmic binding fold superfamily protein [Hanstruepera marina]|uniref:type 1 periplasmic binding fold superfamily protein n=1 Tax=Hanstruepera marina TaxID=2873265 RepID=UPI001CA70BD9|nr:type 1 periplasmic binding fold superfamily protein [Hanstruepera marina]
MKSFLKLLTLLLITNLIVSCSNDDDNTPPPPVNEEEVITTMTITFMPQGGGTDVVLKTQDLDGDGPNPPVVTISGPFASNTTYTGSVEFLNELEDPAEDITEEVQAEGLEHQVFFTVTNSLGTVTYNDMDADGNPIGLDITFQTIDTGSAVDGDITVTLRHEPNKDAAGVSDGDITNAGGETDIEETFTPVTVE